MTRMAEVVVSWGEALLEIRHVRPRRGLSAIEPLEAPVVVNRGGRLCCLVPPGARASLVARGAYRSLEDDQQLEGDASGARRLVLADDTSVRVEVGALTYEIRPTAPARGAPRSARSALPAWIIGSALLHVPLVAMMLLVPPPPTTLALDRVEQARRLVTIEVPPLEVEAARGMGGSGERHAGSDGAMGDPDERPTGGRYAVPRARREAPRALARDRARESMESIGAIGALNAMMGSWDTPISPYGADQASGHDPLAALGALMGNQIGSNGGADGLGMRGTGRGGGGTGQGTIGLGALGTIGHGAGCTGGHCEHESGYRGSGGLARRESRAPIIHCGGGPSGGCAPAVRGGLSRDVIRRVVRRHLAEVRFCYEQGLQHDPSLEGRVSVQWIVGGDGRVMSAASAASDLSSAAVEQCIVSAVSRWSFPSSDGPTGVTYPFVLQSS